MWKITLTQQILHRRCKLALAININYGQSQKPGSRDAASLASYFEADLVCTMGGWGGTIKWPPGRRPASDVVCQAGKVRPKHKSANLVGLPPPEIVTDSMLDILGIWNHTGWGDLKNIVASVDFPIWKDPALSLVCGDPGPSNFSNLIRYFHQSESDIKGVNCQKFV